MLGEVAQVLQSGDMARVSSFSLRLKDLMVSPAHVDSPEAIAAFDDSVARQNTTDLSISRYRRLKINAIKPGPIETHVHVEGTEFYVDRMRDSQISYDQNGREITASVMSLVRNGGCWKLEHFGNGTAAMPNPQPTATTQRRIRNPEGTGFREFSNDDFCRGLAVYRSPSQDAKIGTLVEGYRRYRDPQSGRLLEAVLLQSLATGHVSGIWMSQQQLLQTYVNRSDHHLQDCSWSVRDKEVSPLPDETPAQ